MNIEFKDTQVDGYPDFGQHVFFLAPNFLKHGSYLKEGTYYKSRLGGKFYWDDYDQNYTWNQDEIRYWFIIENIPCLNHDNEKCTNKNFSYCSGTGIYGR
jgi:hypothetical protein